MKHDWSTLIHDVNYSQSPTDKKIMLEDSKKGLERFDRIASELWFATKAYMEFHYFLINPQLDMTKLTQQLTQRKCLKIGARDKIEAKRDYISRGFESPDEADSLTLFVHAARMGSGVTVSMAGGASDDPDPDEDWSEYPNGIRIDLTNRVESLDMQIL
jgi:hypothetical protein